MNVMPRNWKVSGLPSPREARWWETAPAYLVRDNDAAYGQVFKRRVRAMGIRDRPISPRSPWQNPYAERLIGTLRRDCLDHVVIFGARHLHRVLTAYSCYYNQTRTDLSQGRAARSIDPARGSDCCCADSVGPASLLFADMFFRRDRYPASYAARGRALSCPRSTVGNT